MSTKVKFFLPLAAVAVIAAVAASCAKSVTDSENLAKARAFNAWISTHDLGQTCKVGHGVYITKDIPGTGEEIPDSCYIFFSSRIESLMDSSLVSYTDEQTAKQMGTYSQGNWYGANATHLVQSDVMTGVLDIVAGGEGDCASWDRMRVGGYREGIIPGWLTSTSIYDTEAEYIQNVSGTDYYFRTTISDFTTDIEKWQYDTIQKFMIRTGKVVQDTTGGGIWYYRDKEREALRGVTVREDITFSSDTTVYINYIGRLINGKVFDTNVKDTAKMYGIYSTSGSYEPVSVTWSSDSTGIKMSSSSVISGFSQTLWQMHPFESGRGIFPARLGYGSSGSSPKIPGYAPLVFDIDIVEAP